MSAAYTYTPIGTGPFRRLAAALLALVSDIDARATPGRLSLKDVTRAGRYLMEATRLQRAMRQIGIKNLRGAAMARLLADADYRASIRQQLGGEAKIKAWAARLRFQAAFKEHHKTRAAVGQWVASQPASVSVQKPSRRLAARRSVTTAASGLFRLAPIERLEQRRSSKPSVSPSFRAPVSRDWRLKPYPLRPHHLAKRRPQTARSRASWVYPPDKAGEDRPPAKRPFGRPI